jgi:hypothetical protein
LDERWVSWCSISAFGFRMGLKNEKASDYLKYRTGSQWATLKDYMKDRTQNQQRSDCDR